MDTNDFPWTERATLVRVAAAGRPDDQSSVILFEGSLLAMALKVRAMKARDRQGLRLSLPDRQVRPHTFQDATLSMLVDSISKTELRGS